MEWIKDWHDCKYPWNQFQVAKLFKLVDARGQMVAPSTISATKGLNSISMCFNGLTMLIHCVYIHEDIVTLAFECSGQPLKFQMAHRIIIEIEVKGIK